MAQWIFTQIEFENCNPSQNDIDYLNSLLIRLDYDAPQLYITGIYSSWRSPSISLKVILALFYFVGFPCKGRQRQSFFDNEYAENYIDCESWIHSNLEDIRFLSETDLIFIKAVDLNLVDKLENVKRKYHE